MIYAYARLSRENEQSVSIADQVEKIRLMAQLTDRTIEAFFVDEGRSGKNLERPELTKLLDVIHQGDTVIVARLDRLTRSVRDLSDLIERGIVLVSVSEQLDTASATGRMMVNILGTIAQWERETIVERTLASLTFKRQNHLVYSGIAPYGYKAVDGKLVHDDVEYPILKEMIYNDNDGRDYGWIALQLNHRGATTKTGELWTRHNVKSVLAAKKHLK